MSGRGDVRRVLAIDIGGSGIKAMVTDRLGNPLTRRARRPTPAEARPQPVLRVVRELAGISGGFDCLSVGFPGVVVEGRVLSAPNLHPDWIGFALGSALEDSLGRPARVANDADVQGLAVIQGDGVELVLTLGTGLGSALFTDGHLVPNLELAHHPFRQGRSYEECLGEKALGRLGAREWNRRLMEATQTLEELFHFHRLYLGGGNARRISVPLPGTVQVISDIAGLVGGAALWR